ARHSAGPLAQELALVVAEVECGAAQRDALEGLRRRVPDAAVGALAAALERSRRYGSPLAEQLHALAQGLRAEARRRIEERAARAAPKIQLVVALVLVPSVLLVIVAALIANADALLAGLACNGSCMAGPVGGPAGGPAGGRGNRSSKPCAGIEEGRLAVLSDGSVPIRDQDRVAKWGNV